MIFFDLVAIKGEDSLDNLLDENKSIDIHASGLWAEAPDVRDFQHPQA